MKRLLFFLLVLAGYDLTAKPDFGGGSTEYLLISFSDITDAEVCGKAVVHVTFSNMTASDCVLLNDLSFNLAPEVPDGSIVLSDFQPNQNPPQFSLLSGMGSSHPVFGFNGQIDPGKSVELSFEVRFSCILFNNLDDLENNLITLSGLSTAVNCMSPFTVPTTPFYTESAHYDIAYAYVTPGVQIPPLILQQDARFGICIPLEVSGNNCNDQDFTFFIDCSIPCIDFSNAIFTLKKGNHSINVQPQFVLSGSQFSFEINTSGLGRLCETDFPGGMGELELCISKIYLPCNCGAPNADYTFTFGFSSCSQGDAPPDCTDANGHLTPQVTTDVNFKIAPVQNTTLSISNISGSKFNLCKGINTEKLSVKNTGSEAAYDLQLNISAGFNYMVTNVKINGASINFPYGSAVQWSASQNQDPNLGLSNLYDPNYYSDLLPGEELLIEITYQRFGDCALGSLDACNADCNYASVSGSLGTTVDWSDKCHSAQPKGSTTYNVSGNISNLQADVYSPTDPIYEGETANISIDLWNGAITGFNDYLDNEGFGQYICVQTNAGPGEVVFGDLLVPGLGSIPCNNGIYDLGQVPNDLIDQIVMDFDMTLVTCTVPELEVYVSTGVYLINCPDCKVKIGCNDINFLTGCSGTCNGGGLPGYGNACEVFNPLTYNVYNEFDPSSVNPVPVYPCDDLVVEVSANIALPFDGGLAYGFVVSEDFTDYFTNQTEAKLLFTPASGAPFYVPFHQMSGPIPIAGEPLALYYTTSQSLGAVDAGSTVAGQFSLRMNSDFPFQENKKLEHFFPVFGFEDPSGNISFCIPATFPPLVGLNVGYDLKEVRTASCAEGGKMTITLTKTGGFRSHKDFNIDRVVAKFTETVVVNGTTVHTDLMPLEPNGAAIQGQTIQQLIVNFDENCEGIPLDIAYDIWNLPGSELPCSHLDSHTSYTEGGSNAFPEVIVDIESKSIVALDNYYTIHTTAQNIQGSDGYSWMQFEYDPDQISISPADFVLNPGEAYKFAYCNNKSYLIIYFPANSGLSVVHDITLHFLQESCASGTRFKVTGMHGCTPIHLYEPNCSGNTNDGEICTDSNDDISFNFKTSRLRLQAQECSTSADDCNTRHVSILVDNILGEGNTNDVYIQVDVPAGFNLVEAEGEYGGSLENCYLIHSPVLIDENELAGTGWRLEPAGVLKGTHSNAGNDERRFHVLLTLEGCEDSPTGNLVIRARGLQPCGDIIFREKIMPAFEGSAIRMPCDCPEWTYHWGLTSEGHLKLILENSWGDLNSGSLLTIEGVNNPIFFTGNEVIFPENISEYVFFTLTVYTQACNPSEEMECDGLESFPDANCCFVIKGQTPGMTPTPGSDTQGGDRAASINFDPSALWTVSVKPNPFQNGVEVLIENAPKQYVQLYILDITGKVVKSENLTTEQTGISSYRLDLDELASGVYTLRLCAGDMIRHRLIIKQ